MRSGGDGKVPASAACLLGLLAASNEAFAGEVIAHGGAALLVQRLQSGDTVLQTTAVGALGTLTCWSVGATAALEAGAVPPMVNVLRSRDVSSGIGWASVSRAVRALHNLLTSSPAAAAAAIEAAGGRAALQRHAHSRKEVVQQSAAAVLRMLAEHASPPAAPPPPLTTPVCAAEGCAATAHLRRWGGCGRVRYCSVGCSQAHWYAHRGDCKRWRAEAMAAASSEAAAPGSSGARQP